MRGPDVRDALFARLFGITSIIQSGSLFASSSSLETFDRVIDNLLELGLAKGWLRESAWWGILCATEGVSKSDVEWKDHAVDIVVEKVYADKAWSQEKIALTLVLEARRPVNGLQQIFGLGLTCRTWRGRACSPRHSSTPLSYTLRICTSSLGS